MSTYVIGDVHGCFDELKKLLKKISFNSSGGSNIFTQTWSNLFGASAVYKISK